MKKYIYLSLSIMFIFLFILTPDVYAASEKTLLILVDELSFFDIDIICKNKAFGVGFVNIKTLDNDVEESLYLSIALGRKVGTSQHFQGLYKTEDGRILLSGFQDMLASTINGGDDSFHSLLGERLKAEGISYIGSNSSAIIAADEKGEIKTGEIEIKYELPWLIEKTNFHLKKTDILVLDYHIDKKEDRLNILKAYLEEFEGNKVIILSKKVSQDMEKLLNNYLVPVLYKNDNKKGILTSSSTRRDGFIVLEDIYGELVYTYDEKDSSTIGNKIELIKKEDNLKYIKAIYNNTNNLIWISYIFHGIIYAIQFYCGLVLYRIRKRGIFERVHFLYSFMIISIFISFIMGISNYHVNIPLYVFINLIASYMVATILEDKGINAIGVFSLLIYGYILVAALFFPEVIYKSYIGVNNLFYGARYYGFNNGIMGVFIATSLVSCLYLKRTIGNKLLVNLAYILFALTNMLILSASFGANTGGFITATILFMMVIYDSLFKKIGNIKTKIGLAFFALFLFALNMYFDILSEEKSHAISFLIRVKEYGIREFLGMAFIKLKELVRLTILPPFSIVIISQLYSIKYLSGRVNIKFAKEVLLIFIVSLIAFIINDTGNIAFIFMNHFLIALFIDKYLEDSLFL